MHQNTSFSHQTVSSWGRDPLPCFTPQVPPLQLDPGYASDPRYATLCIIVETLCGKCHCLLSFLLLKFTYAARSYDVSSL